MKLVVIGLGQCGCNIADQFCAIGNYSRSFFNRRVTISADVFAVNTNQADLDADAVILLDNEKFMKTDISLAQNFKEINEEMAKNFYDLCCAADERNPKYLGSKIIDAGDIKESLEGICTIGQGVVELSTFYPLGREKLREIGQQRISLATALQKAQNNLSMQIEIQDARKILVLVTAPKDVITLASLQEIATFLQNESPKSVVRIGDYPRRAKEVSVSLVASRLTNVPRVETLYLQAEDLFERQEEIYREAEDQIKHLEATGRNLPTLD